MAHGYFLIGTDESCRAWPYRGMESGEAYPLPVADWPPSLTDREREAWEARLLYPTDAPPLLDEPMAREYYRACCACGLAVRVLYARTVSGAPSDAEPLETPRDFHFLGYDVGDLACDFHSTILTDMLLRPTLLPHDLRSALNEYGLFRTEAEALDFLHMREAAKKNAAPMTFEEGEMYAVKLYELDASLWAKEIEVTHV